MRHPVCLLIGLFCFAPIAAAQSTGPTAFNVATLDATTRGAGLGGAVSASPLPDAGAWLYNPALLSGDAAGRVSFSLANHLSSLRTGGVGYAHRISGLGTGAVGLRFVGWGEIPRTDASGTQDGTFSASELALSVALSRDLKPGLRIGGAVHALRSAIDGQAAAAMSLDAGLLLHRDESGFAAAASIHHAGVVFSSLGSTRDELPFDVRVGISKKLRHMPLNLSATAYGFFDASPIDGSALAEAFAHLLLGAEFQFSDTFQLRLGYDHRRHDALRIKSRLDFAGVSFGAGLRIKGMRLDYARSSWSSLGAVHRFGFSTGL